MAAAMGKRPYPWESEVGVFRNVPELRILGAVVKGCLCRYLPPCLSVKLRSCVPQGVPCS